MVPSGDAPAGSLHRSGADAKLSWIVIEQLESSQEVAENCIGTGKKCQGTTSVVRKRY